MVSGNCEYVKVSILHIAHLVKIVQEVAKGSIIWHHNFLGGFPNYVIFHISVWSKKLYLKKKTKSNELHNVMGFAFYAWQRS